MRKRIATFLLVAISVVTIVGVAEAAIHNPSRDRQCFDYKDIPKECDPAACTCLFHYLEETIISIFRSK
ncbi:MAG TPA: hypothetical protein PKA82_15010 [Pyrinomonadaceae bacterium]|nr:hypothetical protein [Pyrinomonadaceae bacterium]